MADDPEVLTVNRHEQLARYEGRLGADLVTVIDFVLRGQVHVVTHTGTEPQWRERGFAGQTTRAMLDDIRATGGKVQPVCPFVVDFMASHPEYADLRV
jgi:predicted GNAT family acetyltransferase